MVEALEAMAVSVDALPGADIGSMAVSAEIMPGGNYETLDLYTDGILAMNHCNPYGPCYMLHEQRKRYVDLGNQVVIDKKKSTINTVIIKDYSSDVHTDTYIHHDKGPGRKA